MTKKYYLIIISVFLALLLTGCSSNQPSANTNAGNNNQPAAAPTSRMNMWENNPNLIKLTAADLKVGQKLMVMGSKNSDKSITAQAVIVGDANADFQALIRPPQNQNGAGNSGQTDSDNTNQPSAGNNNQSRPNADQWQALSNEQRAQMQERFAQNGGQRPAGSGGSGDARAQFQRLEGEIISIDQDSITIKLDSGSAIVYFSQSTFIGQVKTND